MSNFWSIREDYSENAMSLAVHYTSEDIVDPLVLDTPSPTPEGFLSQFRYSIHAGDPEDMLSNDIGWSIFSPRVVAAVADLCRSGEVEVLSLPIDHCKGAEPIRGYCVLGVKRWIECLDYSASDILWSEVNPPKRHILSFRRCAIRASAVPSGVNCFMLTECPAFAVVTATLADRLALLRPTGFVLEKIHSS